MHSCSHSYEKLWSLLWKNFKNRNEYILPEKLKYSVQKAVKGGFGLFKRGREFRCLKNDKKHLETTKYALNNRKYALKNRILYMPYYISAYISMYDRYISFTDDIKLV